MSGGAPPLPRAFTDPGLIAHRGLHGPGRAENGLAAFEAAAAAGYAVELDVQPSADGVAMAFHDDDLVRLTGAEGRVRDRDAAALGALPLRGGGETVPTLAAALAAIAGRVPVVVEIKDQHGDMGPTDGGLEAAVARDLAAYDGPAAAMSFNPHSVAAMARLAPDVPRGLVTSAYRAEDWPGLSAAARDRLRDAPDAGDHGIAFVSHQADDLDAPRVAELRAAGLAVLCWTIRSAEQEARARRYADAVTFEGYLP